MQDISTTSHTSAYIKVHLAVFLFGFTAILGDLIALPAIMIVWWRVLITSISLFILMGFGKTLFQLPLELIKKYAFIGMLIGLHWICFYGSIKLSNASICLISMSSTSLFTAIIEPIFVRTAVKKQELFTGLLIIPAMVLITNSLDSQYVTGMLVGLLSALLAAVFSVMNKANIKGADPFTISFIELSSAWVMISVLLLAMNLMGYPPSHFWPSSQDWWYLMVLALVCTTLAHVLTLQAMRHISAFSSNLIINLEPVYGIILAIVILKEHKELNTMFFIGTSIIFATVMLYPLINKKLNTNK